MKKYEYSDGGECVSYDTLSEILENEIILAREDDSFYYIKIKPTCFYDNSMMKINKSTGKVTNMLFTQYICNGIEDKSIPVDVNELRQRV